MMQINQKIYQIEGLKMLFKNQFKTLDKQERKLQVVAYCSGTGTNMSIVFTSKYFGKIWDMQATTAEQGLFYRS